MKKILFLMAIAITIQFAAKAQTTTCPGYTFPPSLAATNLGKCGIDILFFVVARNNCNGSAVASATMSVVAGTGFSIPLPASFTAYNPANYVIMAQITWSSATGCDQTPTKVQVDGMAGVGNNCWSCGLYVGPGSGSTALMPSCPSCNPTGTARVEWEAISGNLIVRP